jgi:mono/diheme cytochrome c family protein
MSYQNPGVESPKSHPDEALQPTSPDFKEMPHVPPLAETRDPIPTWLFIVCGIILFLSGSSFTGFDVFGQGMLDQGPGGPVGSSATAQVEAPATPMDLGKKVYGQNCANCHQGSGAGQPGSYPPLVNSEYVLGSKQRLIAILLKGIQGPLTVQGSVYSTAVMPAQESVLTPEKIANLATYLRGSWGNKAGPVSVDEVSAAKAKFASQNGAWTEADLMKIAPNGPDPTDKPAAK